MACIIIGMLMAGVTAAIAAACTKAGTGSVTKMLNPSTPYICPSCPTCVASSTQTKCEAVCRPAGEFGCIPVTTSCRCATGLGGESYFDMPTYEDKSDLECTPAT